MAPIKHTAKSEYWQRMVDRFHASGLSVSKFCAQQRISAQSLYQWKRKLQPHNSIAASGSVSPQLIPVQLVATPPSHSDQACRPSAHNHLQIVTPSGFVVRVSSAVPACLIAELLSEIESANKQGGDAC